MLILRIKRTASKPQLLHSNSKQSVTASDDYYSFSEHASEVSSADDQATIVRYKTPGSQRRSPHEKAQQLQSEATLPTVKPTRKLEPGQKTMGVTFDESQTVRRKPGAPNEGLSWNQTGSEISPPTPGVDDTPYIQFAIEQLTRDEELLGRRRGAGRESQDSILVSPIEPEEEPAYQDQARRDNTPRRDVWRTFPPVSSVESNRKCLVAPARNVRANHGQVATNDVFLSVEPPKDHRYSKLDFVPAPLRPLPLGLFIFCCLLMMAGLIFSNVWSSHHNGLWQYDGVGTSRYFVFEFLPQFLASVIILWLLVIETAVHRVLPYSALASESATQRSRAMHGLALFPTNFLIPNLSLFAHGEPLLGVCFIVFWLSLFTVPLQSSFFQTKLYGTGSLTGWRWTATLPIGWTLVALYALLVIALLCVLVHFRRRRTGLIWDAGSLADILVLLERSNVLSHFDWSDVTGANTKTHHARDYRLGYWTTSNRPQDIFYGIGEENVPARRFSLAGGKLMEKTVEDTRADPRSLDLESQRGLRTSTAEFLQSDVHSTAVRYRWIPWFLKDTYVVAWAVIAIILTIAFIVVSFVKQVVHIGFPPLLPAPTTSQGFSPADFLYSFLPSLIGMILFLLWQPIDLYFRALQPFASLAKPHGAIAEESLLLDYLGGLPFEVSIRAALAGHFKVAWLSFVSLISITLPILGGGIFTAQFVVSKQDVLMRACMPAYYALIVFTIIYALSFLVIWPTRKRYLPHDIRTLADLISFVYQSPLLGDPAFRGPWTKIDLVTRLLGVPPGETMKVRYGFGVYMGRDGKEHLGVDRLQREGAGEMLVATGWR